MNGIKSKRDAQCGERDRERRNTRDKRRGALPAAPFGGQRTSKPTKRAGERTWESAGTGCVRASKVNEEEEGEDEGE